MKCKLIITAFLIFIFAQNGTAQQYEPPSREMVQNLLDGLEECQDLLNKAESNVQKMEENPDKVTLKTYQEGKRLIGEGEACIADIKRKLDELRKDYPGWFNSPNASVDLDRGRVGTAEEIKRVKRRIEGILASVSKRIENIMPPEK